MVSNKDLIQLGFKAIPHFTIGNSVTLDCGRGRILSAASLETPNEMLFLIQREHNSELASDIIVIHNYDYDGELTIERAIDLVKALKP